MTDTATLDAFAEAFGVLGRLHLAPAAAEDMEGVVALLDQWPLLHAPAADPHDPALAHALEALRRSRDIGETAEQARRDHDRLYGRTAAATVPPFESVHRGEEGLVFDTQTLQVRRAYRAAGLQAPRLNREPDDHIGLELDFVARCCRRAVEARERGEDALADAHLTAAARFTAEHLGTWAPAMLQAAARAADTRWMRGRALLTAAARGQWTRMLGIHVVGVEARTGHRRRRVRRGEGR